MTSRIGVIFVLVFGFVLTGCGVNSVEEVLEEDIFYLEVLTEIETEYGNVVFYKTEKPSKTFGARLLKKNGMKWDVLLGGKIPAIEETENIAWAWQSSNDKPAFIFGIIENDEIKKLSINETDAIIVNMEREYKLFYLITNENPLSIQENGEKGVQIKGYSDEGDLLYQRLNFN